MELVEQQWQEIVEKITGPELWFDVGEIILKIILIIVVASIAVRVGTKLVDRVFRKRDRGPFKITERRENTLKKLVQNTLSYVVYFTAFMMVLDTVHIPIGALLAGAGVAGLAIGFGTQNLVKDVVTGFFIIFEDQFSVGDFIRTASVEGTVEEIGLRTTKILSWTGEVNIIPNGNITQVTNYSMHNSIAVVDINIPYEVDVAQVEPIINDLLQEMPNQYTELVAAPEILGVQMLDASHIVLRVTAEVHPMEHWRMARILRKDIKAKLDQEGIDIPLPRMVMYTRDKANAETDGKGV
ncbi:mechanosensitive ion channel family protein [Radiobacillus sp. PE A8.2]|uniref:mechanosensitive ion channel family protein n=1 Tax=Radiobacillus sp. PE A8.2 TaxID=3380349 RepID=UPI00388E1603